MHLKLGTTINNSKIGFRRYFKWQRSYIFNEIGKAKFNNYLSLDEIEVIVDAMKVKELDDAFLATLYDNEKELISLIEFNKNNSFPAKYRDLQ